MTIRIVTLKKSLEKIGSATRFENAFIPFFIYDPNILMVTLFIVTYGDMNVWSLCGLSLIDYQRQKREKGGSAKGPFIINVDRTLRIVGCLHLLHPSMTRFTSFLCSNFDISLTPPPSPLLVNVVCECSLSSKYALIIIDFN